MQETTVPAVTSVQTDIAGTTHDMPVTFRALQALSAAGIDPLTVASNAASGKPMLTLEQVAKVITIGVQQSGGEAKLDHVGAHVMANTGKYLSVAFDYVASFCSGGPSRKNAVAPQAQVPQG